MDPLMKHATNYAQRDEIIDLLHQNPAALGRLTFKETDALHKALGLQRTEKQ